MSTLTTARRLFPTPSVTQHVRELGRHVGQCQACHRAWFAVAAAAERVDDVLAPRFFTTVTIAALLVFGVSTLLPF